MRTLNSRIITENPEPIIKMMGMQKLAYNLISPTIYEIYKKSGKVPVLKVVHDKCYKKIRKLHPEIPSQIVIKAQQDCRAAYKTTHSNKHEIAKPIRKKNLSIRLDKRIYSNKNGFKITNVDEAYHTTSLSWENYPRLQEYSEKYKYLDPLIFQKNNELWIALSFDIPEPLVKIENATGIDLGLKRAVATSDGKILQTKHENHLRRKLRYLKRQLKEKGTKSARRHLKKIRHKEKHISKDVNHRVSNWILENSETTIVMEDLKGIKTGKKFKVVNGEKSGNSKSFNNRNSQMSYAEIRRIVTYKAKELGKQVLFVNPKNTSKDDHRGLKAGERKGCRYYGSDGKILDADINAAVNIALRSRHPVTPRNWLDGQAEINRPIVCQSQNESFGSYKPRDLSRGS